MNIALIWKLVKLRPQLTQIYDEAKPIIEKLPPLIKAAQPVIKEVQEAWPHLGPLIQAVVAELSPDLLKPVDEHYDVKWVQDSLNKLGAHIEVDGDYGPQTKEAVKHFQKAHNLTPDGWCGTETSAAIHDALK